MYPFLGFVRPTLKYWYTHQTLYKVKLDIDGQTFDAVYKTSSFTGYATVFFYMPFS